MKIVRKNYWQLQKAFTISKENKKIVGFGILDLINILSDDLSFTIKSWLR